MKLKKLALALAAPSALALGTLAIPVTSAQVSAELVSEAKQRYFVFFAEPGAFHYQGGVAGLARTAASRPGERFQANRAEVASYRAHLAQERQKHLGDIARVLGRSVQPTYEYDILNHAVVIEDLSASDMAKLAALPQVREVQPVQDYELATDRVREFIDAGSIWDGSAVPGGSGYRGEGMVIGVIDTGLTPFHATHGSFLDDAACGFDAMTPKVIAAKDCIGSATCAGASPFSANNAHGTHVASTAAGNTHVATGGALAGFEVSGVAPCARLITYKACPTSSCDGAALAAARQTAVVDGVDILNYSISGGGAPWTAGDSDRDFLDLVNNGTVVFASAGNTNATVTNPIGAVNHRGPWVMSVANSTHDRVNSNDVNFDLGGPVGIYGVKGEMAIGADVTATVVDGLDLGNPLGCTAFPGGSMTGSIALIERGSCNFSVKLTNAQNAGAIGAIMVNATDGQPPIVMGSTAGLIPAVMVFRADGLAIRDHVDANPATQGTISATTATGTDLGVSDILAASSLRGPMPTSLEYTKPDITGPGSTIFAAMDTSATDYNFLSGTSMSSPHLAGAGALIKGLNPSWTPMEVKSALQLTAKKSGLKDFVNGTPSSGPWDADDVGNGRLDLSQAALAGLVMDETGASFLAANGNVVAQRALNLPSMRNTSCSPSCTFTRTVRNTLSVASNWTAAGTGFGGNFTVDVSPTNFAFSGDTAETQALTITVTPNGDQTAAMVFGEVNLTEGGALSPELHMTLAIRGSDIPPPPQIALVPENVSASGDAGAVTPVEVDVDIGNLGSQTLDWNEAGPLLAGRGSVTVVWDQPQSGTNGIVSSQSVAQNAGAYTAGQFALSADTNLTEIRAIGFDPTSSLAAQPGITWTIFQDLSSEPDGNPQNDMGREVWSYTTTPGGTGVAIAGSGDITLNLVLAGENLDLPAGLYWLSVYPTYTGSITTAGAARWNWFQSNRVGTGSKLIAPTLFGNITDWTLTGPGGLGTAIEDVAFRLSGIQGSITCGAPWLSIDPTSGSVAGGASQTVTLSLDASGLAHGIHDANLCIESNDPVNPEVILPVRFTVSGVVAVDDAEAVDEDVTLSVAAPGVLDNDIGTGLTASLISGTANGSLSLQGDGSFEYTPNADFCGSDSFVYEADNGLVTDQATVDITVNCVNDAPVAGTLADQSGSEGEAFSFDTSGAFSDIDGDALDFSATGLPAALTIDPVSGEISGVPLVGDAGVYDVEVTVDDGSATASASFQLSIDAIGEAIFTDGFESP